MVHLQLVSLGLLLAGLLQAEPVEGTVAKAVRSAGIDPVFLKHGIKIERADEPGAAARLGRLVGPEVAAQISPGLKPYVLFIENSSNAAIVEIHSVIYRYSGLSAPGIPGISSFRLGPNESVAPGDFFIVGEGGLTQALMDKAKRGILPSGLAESQAAFIASSLDSRRFPLAEAVVDAIVMSDGRVLGPDRSGIVEHRQAALRAMQQVLARLEDRSLTDDGLKQWLGEAIAGRAHRLKADGMPDHGRIQLGGFAGFVERQLQARGREQTAASVVRMLASQTAVVNNVVSVKE